MINRAIDEKRYALVLQLTGHSTPAIAKLLDTTPPSIHRWRETDDYKIMIDEMVDVLKSTLKIANV